MPIVVDPKLIKHFKTQKDFRDWLSKNHDQADGIWVKLFRKNSGVKSLNYDEALDVALCFGWIDGQVKKLDDINSWVQKFTPRRKRSVWSLRNTQHTERLIKLGLMTASGQKAIDEAKKDGRWDNAYAAQSNFTLPKDFLIELKKNKKAFQFYEKLSKSKKFSIYWKLTNLKSEEKKKEWKAKFIDLLSQEKF